MPTKVHLVKAMVFPVVMYGCESWTIKKAERRRIDAQPFGAQLSSQSNSGSTTKPQSSRQYGTGTKTEI